MKINFLRILGAACLVLFMGSSITSCSVEDGVDGINGIDGSNGVDGTDGANGNDGNDGADGTDGADGADAIGLEEFANYGSIELRVQGIRPDNVVFDYETELEFISPELSYNSFYDRSDLQFYFLRLLDSPNAYAINGTVVYLRVNDAGLPSQNFEFEIDFSDFAIFSDDLKYITLQDLYEHNDTGVSNMNITDYSFDDTTNNLKFSFTMDVAGANNETGNNLSISGTVDVIVFENIGTSSKAKYLIK